MALPATTYDTATASNPSSALTDFTLMVDLSRMSSAWWAVVDTSDGTKGRAAKNDGTELAVDWIDFDDSAETGWARVLWTGSLASSGTQVLRLYPPVSGNASVAASGTYGSDNAYNSGWSAYFTMDEASGSLIDRTANGSDLTVTGSPTYGATGVVGGAITFGSGAFAKRTTGAPTGPPYTLMAWAKPTNTTTNQGIITLHPAPTTFTGDGIGVQSGKAYQYAANLAGPTATPSWTSGVWGHVAGVATAADDRDLYFNAGSPDNHTTSRASGTLSQIVVAAYATGASAAAPFTGDLDEAQVHSAARSAAWIAHEYDATNDNATFWGTWTNVPVASTGNRRRRLIIGAAA